MDRRGFLRGLFGAGAAALAVGEIDVDKLLWTPGRKVISIPPMPKPSGNAVFTIESITQQTLTQLRENLIFARITNADYDAVFRQSIANQTEMRVPFKIGDVITINGLSLQHEVVGHCQSGIVLHEIRKPHIHPNPVSDRTGIGPLRPRRA